MVKKKTIQAEVDGGSRAEILNQSRLKPDDTFVVWTVTDHMNSNLYNSD